MMHNDGWDHTKLITETIANHPLTNQPGTHWAYSNFGYCILGRVIEQVTNQPYDAYVKANILAPSATPTCKIPLKKKVDAPPTESSTTGSTTKTPTSSTSPAWTRTADGSPPPPNASSSSTTSPEPPASPRSSNPPPSKS